MKKNVLGMILALGAALLFCGCTETNDRADTQESEVYGPELPQVQIESMEENPVLDYQVPVVKPAIFVSQEGYDAEREKRVVIQGKRMPETFKIVDVSTKETIYEGKIESPVYNEETGEYTGYGDFSSLQTPGDYYIECEYLGRSYSFSVQENFYRETMREAVEKLFALAEEKPATNQRPSDEELIERCRTLAALLLACELFPDSQTESLEETGSDMPAVLEYAATQAAYLAKWQDSEDGSLGKATGWYCAALTKLSYTYQKYESVDATRFLQAADLAWKYMEKHTEDFAEAERFFSAAELYRATGKSKYHSVVKELGENLEPDIYNEALTYGAVTYASTRRTIKQTLCNTYLQDMMKKAESISGASLKHDFPVGETMGEERDRFFADVTAMVVVDYIITNEEYGSLIEDYQHYLLGRNERGVSYYDFENCEESAENPLSSNALYLAKYIMIISEIISR